MKIITSATPEFLPGVEALRNSIELNFPQGELYCFFYSKGMSGFNLPERVTYIHEVPIDAHLTDNGKNFRHGLPLGPDMYVRIMIPEYFEGKIFYVDADCLVLNDITDLWNIDLQGHPTACVNRKDCGWHAGNRVDDMASGTFLCDTQKWKELKIMEEIFEVMQLEKEGKISKFKVNVESAMSYVHNTRFYNLPQEYQNLTYYNSLTNFDKVAHFAGPKPWLIEQHDMKTYNVFYSDLWNAYHKNNIALIKELTAKLPSQRITDQFSRPKPLSSWKRKKL